jgi:hypothetical protein
MQVTLRGDSFGRVVGTIVYHGAETTVTGSDHDSAIRDLRVAVESALTHGHGECFWHEAMVDYRWLFRREGSTMRIVIVQSAGTLTGWEHCLWAECGVEEFGDMMRGAIEAYCTLPAQ